jgi:hypothetical protein
MERWYSLGINPTCHLVWVETDELADLDEWDPVLGHQPAHEYDLDAEPARHGLHVE